MPTAVLRNVFYVIARDPSSRSSLPLTQGVQGGKPIVTEDN